MQGSAGPPTFESAFMKKFVEVSRSDLSTLAAVAALAVAWFFLGTISLQVTPGYAIGVTFWKLLAVLDSPAGVIAGIKSGQAGTGFYGVLAAAALLAPLAPLFWKDRRANLGGLLPLAFMLLVAVIAYGGVTSGANDVASGLGGRMGSEIAKALQPHAARQAMRAVSLGAGFYLAIAASLYIAAKAVISGSRGN
jgi:hypothetical protein